MLTKLTLRNFQAHRRLEIDLDPLATTLIGKSDVGKSSIVRALRFLLLNRPQGDAFVRWGKKKASVTLEVGGKRIKREKGKGTNRYLLDGETFKAFGPSVPDAIANLLNVSELNVQGQHDGPFLFDRSPGEVSRELDAVVNLGLIDKVLGHIAKALRKAKAIEEVGRDRLKAARINRNALAWVTEADECLQAAEGAKVRAEQTAANRSRIASLLLEAKGQGETARNASEAKRGAGKAMLKASLSLKLTEDASKLRNLTEKLAKTSSLAAAKDPLADLQAKMEGWELCHERTIGLKAILSRVKQASMTASTARDLAAQSLTRIRGKRCPTCLRPM